MMVFRPSRARVFTSSLFLAGSGLFMVLASGVSWPVRVVGWILVCVVPPGLAAIAKLSVIVEDGCVRVSSIRGTRTFRRGGASAGETSAPGGVLRDQQAIYIRGAEGQDAFVPLGLFRRADRAQICAAVTRALEDHEVDE